MRYLYLFYKAEHNDLNEKSLTCDHERLSWFIRHEDRSFACIQSYDQIVFRFNLSSIGAGSFFINALTIPKPMTRSR